MKVVLFCGGLGLRMREYSDQVPKPMVPIGYRPVLWHLMRYYAHYGHTDFVLCLGHQGDVIKQYFLDYSETISNDFVLSGGGKDVELLSTDIDSWTITFVDTGMRASIGERLMAVRQHVAGEERFLANYADGLGDVDIDAVVATARGQRRGGHLRHGRPPPVVPPRGGGRRQPRDLRVATPPRPTCASTAVSSCSNRASSTTWSRGTSWSSSRSSG